MDQAAIYTDATADVTGAIRDALDTYAVDALRPRYDALVAALEAHACRPLDDDSQESAAAARSEEARLASESASVAADLQAAEDACAAAFSGLHRSLWEPHRIATSPYAAVTVGLTSNGLGSVHRNPGPRLMRIALDPAPTGAGSKCPDQSPCG